MLTFRIGTLDEMSHVFEISWLLPITHHVLLQCLQQHVTAASPILLLWMATRPMEKVMPCWATRKAHSPVWATWTRTLLARRVGGSVSTHIIFECISPPEDAVVNQAQHPVGYIDRHPPAYLVLLVVRHSTPSSSLTHTSQRIYNTLIRLETIQSLSVWRKYL